MRFLLGAWLLCLIGYILTGCSPEPEVTIGKRIIYAIPVSNILLSCNKKNNNTYLDCTDETGTRHFPAIHNATNVVELEIQ